MRRIGILASLVADDRETQARNAAFLMSLQQLGWTDGLNVQIHFRGATDANHIHQNIAELIALAPDVILSSGTVATGPLVQATRTVPIVFVQVVDAVGAGFVSSLARPGGNATGFTPFEYSTSGKWLEVLKEIAPDVRRVAVIRDPTITTGIGQFSAIQAMASSLRVVVTPVNLRDAGEIERASTTFG